MVIAPAGAGLDSLSSAFGDGGRRRSAFGLAQEFLNAADGAMWGIAIDGLTLRVLRDNASLTRPAWIEADPNALLGDKVIQVQAPSKNSWFKTDMVILRWRQLSDEK